MPFSDCTGHVDTNCSPGALLAEGDLSSITWKGLLKMRFTLRYYIGSHPLERQSSPSYLYSSQCEFSFAVIRLEENLPDQFFIAVKMLSILKPL